MVLDVNVVACFTNIHRLCPTNILYMFSLSWFGKFKFQFIKNHTVGIQKHLLIRVFIDVSL